MSQWDDYLASVDGVAIDVDGNWGPQCWDLWSHYAMNNFGCSMWATSTNAGGTYHHPGYTCEIWHNFSTGPLGQWFTPHNGTPQRGDVAIWEWGSAVGPNSHIALVVEDRGGSILCMTQNPGASHYGNLSKDGILGYLRPDNQSIFGGDAPARADSWWTDTRSSSRRHALGNRSNISWRWNSLSRNLCSVKLPLRQP